MGIFPLLIKGKIKMSNTFKSKFKLAFEFSVWFQVKKTNRTVSRGVFFTKMHFCKKD